ncbi:chromosomal replication initiator protein DnaA [Schaalia sp. 19OD2882]|uniref:chromosomal replication initiator protein DnaA n=1 Tax=Schaalia sp. 19OD2882 TaxID=2794089 RepID=UPI001C1EE00F|nr:chromosomal replication initiator protein DnaA [Schaalia sp. 19OD2882]QWW19576.1 chromosomal replication initiator protein DnaA [Schaalia sp. 19OD2882]
MTADSLSSAWIQAVENLDASTLRPAARAFLHSARPLGDIDGTILVAVPHVTAKKKIEEVADTVDAALSLALGRTVRTALTVDPTITPPEPAADPFDDHSSLPIDTIPRNAQAPSSLAAPPVNSDDTTTHLNPKFTFDNFVTGASNRFAHAAAFAVSESPGMAFNPLFIYGDSGLGKTHLLHAIGDYARSLFPHLRVRYVNSEEFTNDFINSIREDRAEEFQRRYREIDVLLIDDIQFIQGKEQTVEEFFHTFNTLYNASKQVVLTSDMPPRELSGIEDRLRSRFAAGLLVDVQPPDLETRIAILQKKAAADQLEIDPAVLEFIASRISSNIRELEGALVRVIAFANLSNERIDLALAEMLLKDFISDPQDTEITAPLIMGQVAAYFGVTIDQLCSQERSRTVVEARQIAMYLCRELTELSLPKIGSAFGGRDHTTVMHANKKIQSQMAGKRETFNHVQELTTRIKQKAREA